MGSAERELRRFLKEVRGNLSGLSWKETRSVSKELEMNIRDHAASISEEMDPGLALHEAVGSMGDPREIACRYSKKVFEKPTLTTYVLILLNIVACDLLLMIGLGPWIQGIGYKAFEDYDVTVFHVLGLVVAGLGILSLIMLHLQSIKPSFIPRLRIHIFLAMVMSIIFSAIMVWGVATDQVAFVRPDYAYLDSPLPAYYWPVVLAAFFLPVAAIPLVWYFSDTKKYRVFFMQRRITADGYIRMVMGNLASLDVVTRKSIRKELEKDVEDRLKEVGGREYEVEELIDRLGEPSEVALMLLDSHRLPKKERLRVPVVVVFILIVGLSLVVSIMFMDQILSAVASPDDTFGFPDLMLSFPLLIVAIAIGSFLFMMKHRPMKKRDYYVPTVALSIAAVLILMLGFGMIPPPEEAIDIPDPEGMNAAIITNLEGTTTLYWQEMWGYVPPVPNTLYATEYDDEGRVKGSWNLTLMNKTYFIRNVFLTTTGNTILLLDYGTTELLLYKITEDLVLVESLQMEFPLSKVRQFGDTLHMASETSFSRVINGYPQDFKGLFFASVRLEPHLEVVHNWENLYDPGRNYYSEDSILIREDRVEIVRDDCSYFKENYSYQLLRYFAFDLEGAKLAETELVTDNLTKSSYKDLGNTTRWVAVDMMELDDDRTLATLFHTRIINGTTTRSLMKAIIDLNEGVVDFLPIINLTHYYPCVFQEHYPSYHPLDSWFFQVRTIAANERIYVFYQTKDYNIYDPSLCRHYEDYNDPVDAIDSEFKILVLGSDGTEIAQNTMTSFLGPQYGGSIHRIISYDDGIVVMWIVTEPGIRCTEDWCPFEFHITLLDENGVVIRDSVYEGSGWDNVIELYFVDIVELGENRIVYLGYDREEVKQTDEGYPYAFGRYRYHLYLGEIVIKDKVVKMGRIVPPIDLPSELLWIMLSIAIPAAAISLGLGTYVAFRMRKSS